MPKKILIADDDRNLVKLVDAFLSSLGYEVKGVFDGSSALKEIIGYKPDLVILDVMMPMMDGYTVCKNLMEDPRYEPTPKLIILTSRKGDMDKRISEFLGADVFVNKPVTPGELAGKVRELLGI